MSAWRLNEATESCKTVFDRAWGGEPQIIMRDEKPMVVTVRGRPSFMNANPENGYRYDDLRPEVKDALREGKEILDGTRPAKWFDSTADLIRDCLA